MPTTSNSESFSINVVGETSGEKFAGVFKTKLRLSHSAQLHQDEIRRSLLGKNPESASPRAQNAAEIFSLVQVHLIDAPKWWAAQGEGLELEDDNVIGAVYEGIVAAKVAALKVKTAATEAAKAELEKAAKAE